MNLKLYRSTVEDRVNKLSENASIKAHDAFLRLIFSLVTGLGYDDLEDEDIIDGNGEYQIDALHIDTSRRENFATVTVIQVTFSDSLSSTKLIKLHAGLDYLLQQPKAMFSALGNAKLKDKIQEFRDLRQDILPSNICLQCYYACLGDPSKTTGEFPEQINRIRTDYGDSCGEFTFGILGPAQIFELMNLRERKGIKVKDRLKIIYDQNKANLLEHSIEEVSGVICTVPGDEIARLVNTHPTVFDENLRRFLGFGGVNSEIKKSCTSSDSAALFWFLNNGITIVCDSYEVHKSSDNPFIAIENLRIVNGCQTSTTLAKTQIDSLLQPSTKVMTRILKTQSPTLASKLLITTNTQNKITSRDLHAQDLIQIHLQEEFKRRYNILWERTANEFSGLTQAADKEEIISNQKIGQAYISVVRKRPSDGSRRQYKIWGDDYEVIFNNNVFPETYLLVYRVVDMCTSQKKVLAQTLGTTDIKRVIIANGTYHLARCATFLWRKTDDWSNLTQIRKEIQKISDEPELLTSYFHQALELLVDIFENNKNFMQDPSVAMKSGRMDDEIDRKLYRFLADGKLVTKQRYQQLELPSEIDN